MDALTYPRAGAQEREQVVNDFVRLCEIESPSRRERTMADAVTADLRALGLEVHEDRSAAETGSDAGNLLARIPAPPGGRTILLCAHLDTVPLDAPVVVERTDEGVIRNRNDAIVGADNKAAVAVILGVARRLVAEGAPPVGLEILFTTCEELALAGAKAFDLAGLEAEFGFVFDHASPIGELIVAAPTYFSVEGRFHGKAAHAGLAPEQGHNAIEAAAAAIASLEFGRLDEHTTSNVGRIVGGTASNVVAERCGVQCEARSIDHERAAAVAGQIVDAMTQAATDRACDVEIDVQELFRGFKIPKSATTVAIAARALEDAGIEPLPISTGGGSDANSFVARGFECLNLANGTQAAHQPDERVTVHALETMLDVALGLVHHSAA
ncbi:MAG: tripeptide aminopeptidase [Thermoleophilaceae bacterium]|nr:tripeptide aminopeptidase [Thermoleophilaceae bacterium]